MKRVIAAIQLARPLNCLIAAVSVLFAGWVIDQTLVRPALWLAVAVVVFITAGANTLNDYFDLPADRVNRPDRPLPAGQISPRMALLLALVEMGAGLFLAVFLNPTAFIIAAIAVVFLVLYTPFLKPRPVIGNGVVALVSALTFIFAGAVLGSIRPVLFPAFIAFCFHLGRELFKDVQDVSGDHHSGYRTLPMVVGIPAAVRVVKSTFVGIIGVLFLPLVWQGYNMWYYILVVIGVIPAVAFAYRVIHQSPDDFRRMERASVLLKWTMLYGLLAIAVGVL